ncbi:carbohydrate sulfotransferase 11-like isoform X2 [Ruditapes philippinarum]|uniref:carbohydrate sulfotransferase 11-like isoform X2 n=1 Tax=Ruditapes philippinarum TaxID=129788 RepID=UPI00295BB87B|nr:carbohydrate sulfotransferase 11-like isoform X2 [Ruditapes philippinarum]
MFYRGKTHSCFIVQLFITICLLYKILNYDYVLHQGHLSQKSYNMICLKNSTHQLNKTSLEFQKQNERMEQRLKLIRQKCQHYMQDNYWQNLRLSGHVLSYEKEQIHFCLVPKAGNTFWKRIIRFLANDFPENLNIKRPTDIDRHYIHESPLINIQRWSMQNPISRMLMTNGKLFMIARDPFSRLWSAYIDKFLLPDFWHKDALDCVKKLRPNATYNEIKCANDVSFEDFLKFICETFTKGLNNHWERLHRICSPCHVQFDVIGTIETFLSDYDYILTKFNLDFLKENTTKLDIVQVEIATLTKYNFDLERAVVQTCFDKTDVAKRLWLAFQYNGYIDRHMHFPKNDLLKTKFVEYPIQIFTDIVLRTIKNQTKYGIDITRQKRTMMLEAYRKIPKDLLKNIISVYKYDFELFGYKSKLFDD